MDVFHALIIPDRGWITAAVCQIGEFKLGECCLIPFEEISIVQGEMAQIFASQRTRLMAVKVSVSFFRPVPPPECNVPGASTFFSRYNKEGKPKARSS
jgi:hypothetical protein